MALKEAVRTIPPRNRPSPDLVRRRWEELRQEAASQHRSVFELSSLIALSSLRIMPASLLKLSRSARTATLRTGRFFAQGLLDHYQSTMREIREKGYLTYWTREFQPYLNAAAKQFSLSHRSMTERVLDRVSRHIS
jgi:hypothetical protein